MKTSISIPEIGQQLITQLSSFFILNEEEKDLIYKNINKVLSRCEYCFSHSSNKYYHKDGDTFFNPYHSGQYSIFLYYFSNTIQYNTIQYNTIQYNTIHNLLADKIYYLNKIMNACDLYYEVQLPRIFFLDHPVGSVMGRAEYGEGFRFSQNCTVGNNRGIYPRIGKNVRMCANSSIIGNCVIGNNVIIGANSGVKDENIPDDSLVFGYSPNLIIRKR